jgi:hypothetical protein
VPMRRKIGQYIVIGLIFVFFAIPFAGISHHCYKYGVPARFLGLVQSRRCCPALGGMPPLGLCG